LDLAHLDSLVEVRVMVLAIFAHYVLRWDNFWLLSVLSCSLKILNLTQTLKFKILVTAFNGH
jgi:hypothetical protein